MTARSPLLTLLAACMLSASPAWGADTAACLDASSKGQTLRDEHQLLEARDQFRACAQPTCPAVVARDCTTWVNELERSVPTVVLSLKDADGRDLFDARVTVDDKPFADALTGAAAAIDPGAHTFRFVRPNGTTVEQQVLVGEGQRDLIVVARMAPPLVTPVAPAAPMPDASPTPLRTAGWIIGAVGVAGLVTGGIFGGLAVADKGSASCNAADKCANFGEVSSAKTAANVADVGLIAGGVLAAGGLALVLLSHGPKKEAVTVTPSVSASAGGLVLRGAW